jgi:hypothetical protein
MMPALQLATSMLQTCAPFLIKVMYAENGFFIDTEFSKIMIFDDDYEPDPYEAR